MSYIHIGEYFQEARLKKNMSQLEVAKELGYTSPQLVSNWERGKCKPPKEALSTLIKIYGLKPKEVLNLVTNEFRKELEKFVYEKR